jgi:hypothetical protein
MRLFLLVLMLLPTLVLAQAPADGYLGRVAVPDQSEAARTAALGEALTQVLERAGGQPLAGQPRLQPTLARAPRLLQRFSYERDPAGGQLMLVAGFDARAVDAALRSAGLPVWGQAAVATEDLALSIGELQGIGDYSRALAALRSLPGVRGVAVLGADGSRLLLRARVEGGAAALASASSPLLQRQADAGGALVYSLAPATAAAPVAAP